MLSAHLFPPNNGPPKHSSIYPQLVSICALLFHFVAQVFLMLFPEFPCVLPWVFSYWNRLFYPTFLNQRARSIIRAKKIAPTTKAHFTLGVRAGKLRANFEPFWLVVWPQGWQSGFPKFHGILFFFFFGQPWGQYKAIKLSIYCYLGDS
jgi:hypothetical protein